MPTKISTEIQVNDSACSPSIDDTSRILLGDTTVTSSKKNESFEESKSVLFDQDETVMDDNSNCLQIDSHNVLSFNEEKSCDDEMVESTEKEQNYSQEHLYKMKYDSYVCSVLDHTKGSMTRLEYNQLSIDDRQNGLEMVNNLFQRFGITLENKLNYKSISYRQSSSRSQTEEKNDSILDCKQDEHRESHEISTKNDLEYADDYHEDAVSMEMIASADMSPPSKIHDSSLIHDVCDSNSNNNDGDPLDDDAIISHPKIHNEMDHRIGGKKTEVISPKALFQSTLWNKQTTLSVAKISKHKLDEAKNGDISDSSDVQNTSCLLLDLGEEHNNSLNDDNIKEDSKRIHAEHEQSTSTLSSVEIVRSDNIHRDNQLVSPLLFQSPTLDTNANTKNNNKRLASTSGKRGMDTHRSRFNDAKEVDEFGHDHYKDNNFDYFGNDDIMSPNEIIESPSQFNCSSIDSPDDESVGNGFEIPLPDSPAPLGFEKLSQSPIKKHNNNHNYHPSHGITKNNREGEVLKFSQDDELRLHSQKTKTKDGSTLSNRNDKDKRRTITDTVETSNCTILPRKARYREQLHKTSQPFVIEEHEKAPSNISLRDGTQFYIDPLHIKQVQKCYSKDTKKGRKDANLLDKKEHKKHTNMKQNRREIVKQQSVVSPNPFVKFSRRTVERLEVAYEWINERDNQDFTDKQNTQDSRISDNNESLRSKGKGVILALDQEQTISMIIHLLKSNGSHLFRRKSYAFDDSNGISSGKQQFGGTLVVVRSKEDLPKWESAFRERTSFSVFNHALIQSAERKRLTMASKCAGFDIILTTFDAIKAKEVATPVDDDGHVMTTGANETGWFSSRSQSSQQQACEVLSVLHGLHWFRIVFIDELGRKSFLTKPGTTRLQAASALNSMSRLIFFTKCTGLEGVFEERLKESRRQLCCVARALHLPEERAGDRIVGEAMLDFGNVQEPLDVSICD